MILDVYRDADSFEDDVSIDEFSDEFEGWVIDALKAYWLRYSKECVGYIS